MPTRTYRLCDFRVAIDHPDEQQLARIGEIWETLFSVADGSSQEADWPSATFHFLPSSDDVPGLDPRAESVSDGVGLQVWKTPNGYRIEAESSLVLDLDLHRDVAQGAIGERFWRSSPDTQRRALLPAIVMLMHGVGRYALHANGVARNQQGWLLVGGSGSGKTTLGLALVRQGWSHLSDDVVLLNCAAAGVAALGVTRGFSCTPRTLATALPLADRGVTKRQKSLLNAAQVSDAGETTECYPDRILFPTIQGGPASRLVPLNPTESLTRLIQNSAGIMFEREAGAGTRQVERQLQALRQLVGQSRSFRFLAGRDVLDAPQRVARLLSETREGEVAWEELSSS